MIVGRSDFCPGSGIGATKKTSPEKAAGGTENHRKAFG